MKCDCINKIDNLLKEKTGDEEARLNVAIDFNSGKVVQYVEYTFRQKNKDGTFKENKKTGVITVSYCPFCGVEIK